MFSARRGGRTSQRRTMKRRQGRTLTSLVENDTVPTHLDENARLLQNEEVVLVGVGASLLRLLLTRLDGSLLIRPLASESVIRGEDLCESAPSAVGSARRPLRADCKTHHVVLLQVLDLGDALLAFAVVHKNLEVTVDALVLNLVLQRRKVSGDSASAPRQRSPSTAQAGRQER